MPRRTERSLSPEAVEMVGSDGQQRPSALA